MSFFVFCGVSCNRRTRSAVSPGQTDQALNPPVACGLRKRPPGPARRTGASLPSQRRPLATDWRKRAPRAGRSEALRGNHRAASQPTPASTPSASVTVQVVEPVLGKCSCTSVSLKENAYISYNIPSSSFWRTKARMRRG